MRKKILFVLGILATNGATMSLISLLRALAEDDRYDLSLFTYVPIEDKFLSQIPKSVQILPVVDEYQAIALSFGQAIRLAWHTKRVDILRHRIARVVRRRFPKLIPFNWDWLPQVDGDWDVVCGYADGFLSEQVVRKINAKKKVLWVHENYEDTKPGAGIREAFEKADRVVCVSYDAIGHFEKWFGKSVQDKAFVVHNVTDPDRCRVLANEFNVDNEGDVPTIVSVGRLSPEKGYDFVPEIVRILNERGVKFKWQIIGGGLPEIAAELQVVDRVEVLGQQPNPYPYIKNAKMLVSLSRAEGWGMNISEALALHKPVVCSNIAVYREQVRDGENGFCVERTPEAFADAIEVLLKDEALYSKMSSAADCEICSPEAVRREFAALVEGL